MHKQFENIGQRTRHIPLLISAFFIVLVGLSLATGNDNTVEMMFVQTAQGVRTDANTLRLVNVSQQTLYFSDRPARLAGHVTMPVYLDEWKAGAGRNDFSTDPPNATLSVYQPGGGENTLTVVTISNPVVDGKDLVYHYKLIEGEMPKTGGATALFIDWVAVAGGGPRYYGPRFYGPRWHGGVYVGPRAVIW